MSYFGRQQLDPSKCQTRIYEGRCGSHQCTRKPSETEDGKLYCKIHAPSFVKQKKDNQRAEWNEKWAAQSESLNRERRKDVLAVNMARLIDSSLKLSKWDVGAFKALRDEAVELGVIR